MTILLKMSLKVKQFPPMTRRFLCLCLQCLLVYFSITSVSLGTKRLFTQNHSCCIKVPHETKQKLSVHYEWTGSAKSTIISIFFLFQSKDAFWTIAHDNEKTEASCSLISINYKNHHSVCVKSHENIQMASNPFMKAFLVWILLQKYKIKFTFQVKNSKN